MPIYCNQSTAATISWRFPQGDKQLANLDRTPIKVDVYGVPNDGVQLPWTSFNSLDSGYSTAPTLQLSMGDLDPDRLHWIQGGGVYNVKSLTCGRVLYFTPIDQAYDFFEAYSLSSPLYLDRNSTFVAAKKQGPIQHRFTTQIYSRPAQYWRIEITDAAGRRIVQAGEGKPTYSVKCDGCPPNTLDCGDCCADCAQLLASLRGINERL